MAYHQGTMPNQPGNNIPHPAMSTFSAPQTPAPGNSPQLQSQPRRPLSQTANAFTPGTAAINHSPQMFANPPDLGRNNPVLPATGQNQPNDWATYGHAAPRMPTPPHYEQRAPHPGVQEMQTQLNGPNLQSMPFNGPPGPVMHPNPSFGYNQPGNYHHPAPMQIPNPGAMYQGHAQNMIPPYPGAAHGKPTP